MENIDADWADDQTLCTKTPAQAESQLYSLEQAAKGIGLCVNSNKTKFICFKQDGTIFTLNKSQNLVIHFTYLGNNISSTESDINTFIGKAWTAINSLSTIWKSNLPDKIKEELFQVVSVKVLLYSSTTLTLTLSTGRKS